MSQAPVQPVRLAEVLGALSLATDLANAQPAEHGLRTALLATRLAAHEALPMRSDVFWAGLLRYLGCNGFALEEGVFSAGDDIGLRASFARIDLGRPSQFVAATLRDLGRGASPAARLGGITRLLTDPGAARRHAHAQCETARFCGRKLGMGEAVLQALDEFDERYDGRGHPHGKRGTELSPVTRYVEVARVAVMFSTLSGVDAAGAELGRRSGGQLDPDMVGRFRSDAPALCEGLDQSSVWNEFLACEPAPWLLGPDRLAPLFEAFALMADLKSGYLSGHSTGVATLASAAARSRGYATGQVLLLEQAALLHDLGRVAVPVGVWDKPGSLTASEWERVHLHSYYTDRVLRRGAALGRHADIAGRCHERLDGSGYHRGESDSEPLARLLAAADTYHALREDRAHRKAFDPDGARRVLLDAAARRLLCPDAVASVLNAAGHPTTHAAAGRGGDALSPREADVLRLMVRGLSNKHIARQLAISPRTVQHHTIHIFEKTGMKSRAGAALWAVEHGLFDRLQ